MLALGSQALLLRPSSWELQRALNLQRAVNLYLQLLIHLRPRDFFVATPFHSISHPPPSPCPPHSPLAAKGGRRGWNRFGMTAQRKHPHPVNLPPPLAPSTGAPQPRANRALLGERLTLLVRHRRPPRPRASGTTCCQLTSVFTTALVAAAFFGHWQWGLRATPVLGIVAVVLIIRSRDRILSGGCLGKGTCRGNR